MNHARFLKEDHLPTWARWDNQVKKGDRVKDETLLQALCDDAVASH